MNLQMITKEFITTLRKMDEQSLYVNLTSIDNIHKDFIKLKKSDYNYCIRKLINKIESFPKDVLWVYPMCKGKFLRGSDNEAYIENLLIVGGSCKEFKKLNTWVVKHTDTLLVSDDVLKIDIKADDEQFKYHFLMHNPDVCNKILTLLKENRKPGNTITVKKETNNELYLQSRKDIEFVIKTPKGKEKMTISTKELW